MQNKETKSKKRNNKKSKINCEGKKTKNKIKRSIKKQKILTIGAILMPHYYKIP